MTLRRPLTLERPQDPQLDLFRVGASTLPSVHGHSVMSHAKAEGQWKIGSPSQN